MTNHRSTATRLFCALAALCEGFDVQAAGVAAKSLSAELHPTHGELGLMFSASGAGLLVGAVIGGRLADRVGRKLVLVVSVALFGAFSLLSASADSIDMLTIARLLTGLGLGGAMPNLIALSAETSAQTSRNTSIAVTYIGMPLGAVIASAIVVAAPADAWRTVFVVGGVGPLVIVPAMIAWMPATARREVDDRPPIGTALFGDRRAVTTAMLWAGFFFVVLTLHLMLNWLPLLTSERGLSGAEAALAQIGFNVGGAAGGLAIGRLLDTQWRRIAITVSLGALPVLLVALAAAPAQLVFQVPLAAFLGAAILAQQVVIYGVASASYPPTARGVGVGAAVAAGRLGSLVGPLVAALFLVAGTSPGGVLLGVMPIGVLCGACVGLVGLRGQSQ